MASRIRSVFSFPNPVNELAARLVAGGVVVLSVVALAGGQPWLLVPLAYGFWARVLTGPTLSPLGQLATRVVAPRLRVPPRLVPGPPKRFAQAMGVVFSTSALVLWFGVGAHGAAWVAVGLLAVAALLESAFGVCLGCKVFSALMRVGLIPQSICEACADITLRHPELRREPARV
ncbi:MAG TPA: DUF4395 domain-containing protein [Acidimicrobiales bacterium]|nr:DUF4395 domain-containing protein [Acidimicrobiales bacterium]